MPAMIRPAGKAKKIAYAILGKPENMNDKSAYKNKDVERRLVFEETYRVK